MISARDLFDIPDDVAYLNTASVGPLLRAAVAASQAALTRRAQPWRLGDDDWFGGAERRRALFAGLIGAAPDDVALVPAVSYGMAVAAASLSAKRGQRVVVLGEDFPAVTYVWRRFAARTGAELFTVTRAPGQTWTQAVLAALDDRAAVVAVPQVHWVDGSWVDLAAIAPRARALGAALVVDASQSLGVVPLDVGALKPDFVASVGYKWMLGPYGLGYLYADPRHHGGAPLEENWMAREGSSDFSRLADYQEKYQPGARRFDVGERSALELTPAAIAALEQVHAWGVENIAATLRARTARIAQEAHARGFATPEPRGPHFLGIVLPPALRERAPAALRAAGVYVGMRGAAMRVSPHVHTSDEDITRLFAALDRAG